MKYILLGILYWSVLSFGQEVLDYYDSFLDNEFENPEFAFQQLEKGLELAKKSKDKEKIALGHKYMSYYYDDQLEYQNAILFIDSAFSYYQEKGDSTELINCYNLKGIVYSNDLDFDNSNINYKKGLQIAEMKGDKEGVSRIKNNIGLNYVDLGDYIMATGYYQEALKIAKEIGDLENEANVSNNLGSVYTQLSDFELSLKHHRRALEIRIKEEDELGLSSVYLNIGRVYLAQKNSDSAIYYFTLSKNIDKIYDDEFGLALNYNNLGVAFQMKGVLDSAIYYYSEALSIRERIKDDAGIIMSNNNMGEYYLELNNFQRAIIHCEAGLKKAEKLSLPYDKSQSCKCLATAYEKKADFKTAYFYLNKYHEIEEDLQNDEKRKKIAKQELEYAYYYKSLSDSLKLREEQKEKDFKNKLLLQQKESEKEAAESRQILQLFLFLIVVLAIITIAILQWKKSKNLRRKNYLISQQKTLIQEQKHEIDASIAYAEKIQQTALPTKKISDLFSESFLVFQPKDVVSGDFYWLEEEEEEKYICVADCTGHGIPGAFISLIGTILLNEIYNAKVMREPNIILNELNRLVQLTLTDKYGESMRDGMDLAFCKINIKLKKIYFSGANNPLWLISVKDKLKVNGEYILPNMTGNGRYLYEIKPDKKPIGKYSGVNTAFSLNEIEYNSSDQIYLFSDGYADQFGGEKGSEMKGGKKFKYKPFKRLLLENSSLSSEQQKEILWSTHISWRGDLEQVDDICIVGTELP